MTLRFTVESYFGLGFRDDLAAVRREEPDLDDEFPLAAGPFVHDGKAMVQGGKGICGNAFEQAHEAEFAAHFLTHVIAEKSKIQPGFDPAVRHADTITYLSDARQSVFSKKRLRTVKYVLYTWIVIQKVDAINDGLCYFKRRVWTQKE